MIEEQKDLIEDLALEENAKNNLKDVALWAKINAIVSFVSLGVTLISLITGYSGVGNSAAFAGGFIGFLISASVSLLLNLTLYQASSAVNQGIDTTDQGYFNLGVTKLATYFKISGILIIVGLSIFVLVILVIMLLGAGRFF